MATRLIRFERLPLDSALPVLWFAVIRTLVVLVALGSLVVLGFPYEGQLTTVLAAVALPWALLLVLVARRSPQIALHPLIAVGDFAVLVVIESVVPETYGAVRFVALFMVAAHAHFQGERRGLAIAAAGVATLVIVGAATEDPLAGHLLEFYETLFVVTALATAAVIGGLRTAESAGRLRARELTHRTFAAEDEVRRRLAESIHDGPVQELVSLEMIIAAARQASRRGESERVAELLGDAEGLAARNVRALRDEIVGLGPHAFQELSFQAALDDCAPGWERRYGIDIRLECDTITLGAELEGALFRIVQEAVANAGRHAQASTVAVRLRHTDGRVELEIEDDGHGFHEDLLGAMEPGHLGLAAMRERAEAVGGRLRIATDRSGTVVSVTAPVSGSG